MLGLFVHTLTADYKYFLHNRESLTQPMQIILSQKQQTFSPFISAFLKSTLNFEHFQKKRDDPHRQYTSQIADPQKCDYINF